MAFLFIENGPDKDLGREFTLGENPLVIGRDIPGKSPDIALHDEFISRRHAEISFRDNCFQLRDLNSTNGTTIDETRLSPDQFYQLRDGSIISLGITPSGARVTLRFKESPTQSTVRIDPVLLKKLNPVSWLVIDAEKGEIRVDNQSLVLARKEYNLIVCLHKRAGKVCSRDTLIADVWPEVLDPGGVADAAIDQLVRRVRAKIEPDPNKPTRLVTRKGFGYMLIL